MLGAPSGFPFVHLAALLDPFGPGRGVVPLVNRDRRGCRAFNDCESFPKDLQPSRVSSDPFPEGLAYCLESSAFRNWGASSSGTDAVGGGVKSVVEETEAGKVAPSADVPIHQQKALKLAECRGCEAEPFPEDLLSDVTGAVVFNGVPVVLATAE